jgi:hypothetical protein
MSRPDHDERRQRLRAALRANLRKRRAGGAAPAEGPPPAAAGAAPADALRPDQD